VKASQAGKDLGGATFGVGSQQFNGPGGSAGADGDLAYFTFVKGLATNLTVPNLDQNESDVEANIGFTQLFGATKVSFVVSQLQGGGLATVKIKALIAGVQNQGATTAISDDVPWTGVNYIDHQDENTQIDIDKVTITRGTSSWTFIEGQADPAGAPANLNVDFTQDGSLSAVISGLDAGDKVLYETATEHDRLQISNPGGATAALDAAFDIGKLQIESGGITTTALPDIEFYDDGPNANGTAQTDTVDEDGAPLSAGNPGGPSDVTADSRETGTVTGIFNAGADGLKTFSLSSLAADIAGLPALTSQGGTVLYNVTGNTLTAYVEVSNANGAGYNATDDREVFTLALSGTNNATYTFVLLDQIDHAAPPAGTSVENNLTLNLGSILRVQDNDNDPATAAANKLVITLNDDSPVIDAGATNIVYANNLNPSPGGTGKFGYSIGLDDRDSYSSSSSDLLVSLLGSSNVGGTGVTNRSVTWLSETDNQAVFSVAFTYVSNPTSGATTNATGTITFDKVNDSYTFALSQPISSFSVLSLNTALGFTGYVENSSTVDSSQPDVSVAQLASNFFVQFRADEEPTGNGTDGAKNGNIDAVTVGTAWLENSQPANDDAFVQGEIFQSSNTWPSVQNTTAGIASDTIQSGEILDFNFFSTNPSGFISPAGVLKTTAPTIFIEFDGLDNGEDLVVLLKLVDQNNPNNVTTIPVICQYGDIFHSAQAGSIPAAFGFTGTLDNNDGLVVIEANDYNFLPGGNWTIQGAQVLPSTEGISGLAIDLNGAINGASSSTLVNLSTGQDGGQNNGGTWDGDVFKIVNIGFVTSVTPDALLNFDVKVIDFDGDTTASQNLSVSIGSATALSGTSGADTFVMTDISATDLDNVLSDATRTISGFNTSSDVLDFTTDATVANFESGANPFASLGAFITEANTQLDGTTDYYFGVVGADGYLAYDDDGVSMTALIKLVGVTSSFDHVDII
jgi:T1SS-143 domain-containing protein